MLYWLELSYICLNKKKYIQAKQKLELTSYSLESHLFPPFLLKIKSEAPLRSKCIVQGHTANQWYKLQQEPSTSINASQPQHWLKKLSHSFPRLGYLFSLTRNNWFFLTWCFSSGTQVSLHKSWFHACLEGYETESKVPTWNKGS